MTDDREKRDKTRGKNVQGKWQKGDKLLATELLSHLGKGERRMAYGAGKTPKSKGLPEQKGNGEEQGSGK